MSTLNDRQTYIKEILVKYDRENPINGYGAFIYNDGLAIYNFVLQTINDGIAEFSIKRRAFDADIDAWEQFGTVRVRAESVGDTDAVIERCRHIYGVPEAVSAGT